MIVLLYLTLSLQFISLESDFKKIKNPVIFIFMRHIPHEIWLLINTFHTMLKEMKNELAER